MQGRGACQNVPATGQRQAALLCAHSALPVADLLQQGPRQTAGPWPPAVGSRRTCYLLANLERAAVIDAVLALVVDVHPREAIPNSALQAGAPLVAGLCGRAGTLLKRLCRTHPALLRSPIAPQGPLCLPWQPLTLSGVIGSTQVPRSAPVPHLPLLPQSRLSVTGLQPSSGLLHSVQTGQVAGHCKGWRETGQGPQHEPRASKSRMEAQNTSGYSGQPAL